MNGGPCSFCRFHQHECSDKSADYHEDHDDVEQENLQVLCVVGVRGVLADLAEVATEALAAHALTVEADAAVHALARAGLDLARHDLDVAAHVLFAAQFCDELKL